MDKTKVPVESAMLLLLLHLPPVPTVKLAQSLRLRLPLHMNPLPRKNPRLRPRLRPPLHPPRRAR